ncbi:MAG: sulfite exporter TauE/SafE family protein [Hyphomicrobiales bacterium]
MFDSFTLVTICVSFLVAGVVKGVIGLGLPIVSVALLTVFVGLQNALALLLIPALCTNVWQGSVGRNAKPLIKAIWPFLTLATLFVGVGTLTLTRVDLPLLSAFLGLVLLIYASTNMAGFQIVINDKQNKWLGPLLGVLNGTITGMTGASAIPGVIYFQARGLHRDEMIQAMGILFALSTASLAISLGGNGLLNRDLGVISAFALIPSIAGMLIGQKIRNKLSESLFRKIFFIALMLLGIYIILSAKPWA